MSNNNIQLIGIIIQAFTEENKCNKWETFQETEDHVAIEYSAYKIWWQDVK